MIVGIYLKNLQKKKFLFLFFCYLNVYWIFKGY